MTFDFDRDIRARYDEQREIAFGRLRADAEQLRALSAAMSETSLDFRDAAAPLFGSWEGEAADRAHGQVAGIVNSADSAWARLSALGDTIDAAVNAAERVVVDMAKAVQELALERVDGRNAESIRLLVDFATDCTAMSDARNWLDDVFVPVYEARAHAFDDACTAAASNLTAAWDELRTMLETIAGQPLDLSPSVETPTAAPKSPSAPADSSTVDQAESVSGREPAPDTSHEGQRVDADTMTPQAAGPNPVGPAALPVAAPAAAGGGGNVFVGGAPFAGGPAVLGGGDREHRRRVPLTGATFGDLEESATADRSVIGGAFDGTDYNEDTQREREAEDRRPATEAPIDEEDDLW